MSKTKGGLKHFIVFLVAVFILGGCSLIKKPQPQVQPPTPQPTTKTPQTLDEQLSEQSKIKKFDDYDELKEFLEESGGSAGFGGGGGIARSMMTKSLAMPTAELGLEVAEDSLGFGGANGESGSTDFSTTNIQVEGVDEGDIIKTDGKYIYAVSKNDVFIIDAYPATESKIISKIAFESTPQDIYINDDKLIVYGYDNTFYQRDVKSKLPIRRNTSYTFFKVFDISNKEKPQQVRDINFEGNYINSRMIGDYVYFITTNYNYYLDEEVVLPQIIENGEVLSTDSAVERCNCPDVYYFNIPYQRYHFTSVASINIADDDQKINNEVYLLAGNQNIYVSQKNIYITYTKYINEYMLVMEATKEIVLPKLSTKEKDKINQIEAVDNFILSKEEKLSKISLILERYVMKLSEQEQDALEKELEEKMKQKYKDISKELEKTVIHKIAVDKGDLEYQTFGEVTGHVLNQFSMDENGDYFRIATTKNRTWSRFTENDEQQSYSNLYVLDKDLKVVGSVENLAKGEQIYSVRFMQGRAYMVTFKQTDPLFVIDLEDPQNPKVLGELKIPGFSNYLHPYDEDTLIGIGKEAKENEWGGATTIGFKLSLFDVSDVANPSEMDKYVIEDSSASSIALYDHKAFLFSKDKNLLVLPMSKEIGRETLSSENQQQELISCGDTEKCFMPPSIDLSQKYFRGAMVFNVDKTGFELSGEISHSDDGSESGYWDRGYNYYDTTVQRSLYIDDVLYTFSNKYLKMNQLNDLELVKNLELKIQNDDFDIIVPDEIEKIIEDVVGEITELDLMR